MKPDPQLINLVAGRKGHFRLESGHHGDRWLDLDQLLLRPRDVRPFAVELAKRLAMHRPQAVCGPLVGGAFVAQMVAEELDAEFVYSERLGHPERDGLHPVEYRVPAAARETVRGKRVAIVDDAISAGSAVRGTFADLEACGGHPVAVGALIVLGSVASVFAASKRVPLESVASLPFNLWTPSECPLCASGAPLD